MQLRERQYYSRLGRSAQTPRTRRYSTITNGSARPPLEVMKTVWKWVPAVIALGIIWFLVDTYIF
jgi:hypothetical protein